MEKTDKMINSGTGRRFIYAILLLCAALALGGVRSCCNTSTTAVMTGLGREYKWLGRDVNAGLPLQRDALNFIDEKIFTLQPPFQEYSYKIGPEAVTDCSVSTGYSAWRSKTLNLQADLSSFALDEVMKICLLARGINDCGELVTQAYQNSTAYHWIKSPPLGDFSITGPDILTNDSTPVASWQPSGLATSYDLIVSSNADCSNPVQSYEDLTSTSIELSELSDGNYYVCVYSKEVNLGTHAALENPYAFEVDTLPPGQWTLSVSDVNNNPDNVPVTWSAASGAEYYKIFISATENCTDEINAWDNLSNNFLNISVPDYGTYYLCGEAYDEAGNIGLPANNGLQFTVSYIETLTLLDSIGSDPLVSDKNISIGNHINPDPNAWYQLAVFNLQLAARTKLTGLTFHMEGSSPGLSGYVCGPASSAFNLKLNIWSGSGQAQNNPYNGDLQSILVLPEALVVRTATGGTSLTGCPIEKLEFDLSYADIFLDAGSDYYLSLGFEGPANTAGIWGILETSLPGTSDWIIYDDYLSNKRIDLISVFSHSHSGKLAVKVVGLQE